MQYVIGINIVNVCGHIMAVVLVVVTVVVALDIIQVSVVVMAVVVMLVSCRRSNLVVVAYRQNQI